MTQSRDTEVYINESNYQQRYFYRERDRTIKELDRLYGTIRRFGVNEDDQWFNLADGILCNYGFNKYLHDVEKGFVARGKK